MPGISPPGSRLAATLRPSWVEVDLDALAGNLETLRKEIAPAGILAVVKADAYGHGAPVVGRFLEEKGVDWLGVALVEEGVELRRAGVRTPVLVLGTALVGQLPLFRRYGLTPTISSRIQLDMWRGWLGSEGGEPVPFHLKVDVGMHRLGLDPAELAPVLAELRSSPRLALGGLLSHLADADDPESPRTAVQERRFVELVDLLTEEERSRIHLHLANSAAALHRPAARHSFVRTGLGLYGFDPARRREEGLKPVMSVVSRVVQLRDTPAGARPGYGGIWTAPRPSRLAVVPLGYADGYSWRLSNRAQALVRGRRVQVVGAVSMDMTLLDVTDVDARPGDEVVLLGRQGAESIDVRELAGKAGTIPYEVLCHLGLRMPRRYRREGNLVKWQSQFEAGVR